MCFIEYYRESVQKTTREVTQSFIRNAVTELNELSFPLLVEVMRGLTNVTIPLSFISFNSWGIMINPFQYFKSISFNCMLLYGCF